MMMEGETSTPVVVREPDEETAFVKKKIEAPRRHQNRMRAKKKRLAVASVSVVTLLALAGVCTFLALPSESPNEMKTAASEAMAADPMNSSQEEGFMPSFDDYDEDGDGKVSLEEYLDCLATNWDAALENVETSSLDDAERAQIEQYLNEDFANHSGCVARFAQQQKQNDGLMTRENFDQVYDQLTTEICPLRDARIPGSYQSAEIAIGQKEVPPTAVSPEIEKTIAASSSSGSEASAARGSRPWFRSERGAIDGSSASSASDASSSGGEDSSESTPNASSDSSAAVDESKTDASASDTAPNSEWSPGMPINPPSSSKSAENKSEDSTNSSGKHEWSPEIPSNPPISAHNDEGSSTSSQPREGEQWNPDLPNSLPQSSISSHTQSAESSSESEWNPDGPIKPSTGEEKNTEDSNNDQWSPDAPNDVPAVSHNEEGSIDDSPTKTSPNDETGWRTNEPSNPSSVEKRWNPSKPASPPASSKDYDTNSRSFSSRASEEQDWKPNVPTDPPKPSTRDGQPEESHNGRIEAKWSPKDPANPPSPSDAARQQAQWNPIEPTNQPVLFQAQASSTTLIQSSDGGSKVLTDSPTPLAEQPPNPESPGEFQDSRNPQGTKGYALDPAMEDQLREADLAWQAKKQARGYAVP